MCIERLRTDAPRADRITGSKSAADNRPPGLAAARSPVRIVPPIRGSRLRLVLPIGIGNWPLTGWRQRLVKTRCRLVMPELARVLSRHGRSAWEKRDKRVRWRRLGIELLPDGMAQWQSWLNWKRWMIFGELSGELQ